MEPLSRLNQFLYRSRIIKGIDFLDFSFLLPALRFLPARMSEQLSKYRGLVRYFLDMDWRSISMGQPHIRQATKEALSRICTNCSDLEKKVAQRFINQSREETEAVYFAGKKKWPREIIFDNIEPLVALRETGRGLVLLSAHYDSCVAGITFLGRKGFRVNIFFDEIVYDTRVPKYLQRFFRKKYSNMARYLNGGNFISMRNISEIYRRLSKGETFIVVSDVMNFPNGIKVNFMNDEYTAPDGALRIALKTNSYLGAFVTLYEGNGVYRMVFSPPTLVSRADDPGKAVQGCYAFLSGYMMKSPERWWVCDKLLEFK
jgi:lauroyl/myristoyl acyltransferase